jgi:arylformamidase
MAAGAPCNVSRMELGTHAGTHVDAPFHFIPDGAPVEALPLAALVGPARVVGLPDAPAVTAAHVRSWALSGVKRLLVRTRNSGTLLTPGFREDFVYVEPEAARLLAASGLLLFGWDYLSIERYGSGDFAAHLALLGAGVVLVEGLDLSAVEPGDYRLSCLPLSIVGADGAPARVVLETLS